MSMLPCVASHLSSGFGVWIRIKTPSSLADATTYWHTEVIGLVGIATIYECSVSLLPCKLVLGKAWDIDG